MKKYLASLLALFLLLASAAFADFRQNKELVEVFKENNVRIIVLCNFEGTNNALDIVTSSLSPGYGLTMYGLAKLLDTACILAPQEISHIYTSLVFRAQQTTHALGDAFNLIPSQLSIDTRLRAQNFGRADGMDYDLYKQLFASKKDMLESAPPNGESGSSVFKRTESFLLSLMSLENQTVLVVTHAFNFCHFSKCLTGRYGNIPPPGAFAVYDFNN